MNSKQIKVVSLFSGIGGFEAGIKKTSLNVDVVFASEIDSFAQKAYAANFTSSNLHGDITKIDEKKIPEHHLLLGGFPCQSFSIAGKRKGFEDTRGTLFFDVARILSAKKPKFVLLENVKNLINHDNSNTIKVILKTLNDIGYTVDFTVINSQEAGVPQNRDRTYICAIYNYPAQKYVIDKRSAKANILKKELNYSEFNGFNFFNKLKFNNKQYYIEDILEQEISDNFFLKSQSIQEFLASQCFVEPLQNEAKILKFFDLPKNVYNDLERQRRVYSIKGISPTVLARSDSTKILVNTKTGKSIRKITPTENFYIQGFEKDFVENIKKADISLTQMYKQSGNAVSPPVITGIIELLDKEFINYDEIY